MFPALFIAILSASKEAMVFGVISPKIRIRIVSTPVAIPTAAFPKISAARMVIIEEVDRFTTLFPMRMALNILLLFS